MKRRKRIFAWLAGTLICLAAARSLLPGAAGRILSAWLGQRTGGRVLVSGAALSPALDLRAEKILLNLYPPGEAVTFAAWPGAAELRSVTVTRQRGGAFHPTLFRVAATGEMAGPAGNGEKRKLEVSGRVTGNFLSGQYQVHDLRVDLPGLGEVEISGTLETRGPESAVRLSFRDFSLAELKKTVPAAALPVEGILSGQALVGLARKDEQWSAASLEFEVAFRDAVFEDQDIAPLSGVLAGNYDFAAEQGSISRGALSPASGGRVDFEGTIDREGFDFSFTATEINIEDILDSLPAEIREKMGLRVESLEGTAAYSSHDGTLVTRAGFLFREAGGEARVEVRRGAGRLVGDYRARLELKGLDLLSLSSLYGHGAVISGILNLDCELSGTGEGLGEIRARAETVPARSVRQFLNFRAVEALMALATDSSPARYLARSDYGYRKLALEVVYRDGELTLFGRARERAGQGYILLGTILGRHINISVDSRYNTVGIEDLRRRLARVF